MTPSAGVAPEPGEPAIVSADGIRVVRNPRASGSAAPGPAARNTLADPHGPTLTDAGFAAAEREVRSWPGYEPTPLHALPGLAARLGLGGLYLKDESRRFSLKSFKVLGGAYAVFRVIQRAIEAAGESPVTSAGLVAGRWRVAAAGLTVTCATDGNHGRAVAWGARLFGCRCVIFVHQGVSEGRCAAIARHGAEVVRVAGNYDDSVRHAASEASRHGWTVVSDTAWPGYREIPIDVMHGYGVMAREIVAQMPEPPTHVFVQAGVGALAAAVCEAFRLAWRDRRPAPVVVEPAAADCFLRSALAGRPVVVTGDLDTVMAGLSCGEVSPLAWPIVSAQAAAFVAVDDRFALEGMRVLATPVAGDPPIVAGETGAAGLAALLAARGLVGPEDGGAVADDGNPVWRALGLDARSRVLLIGSEGDTDPAIYRQVVGRDAAEVAA